MKIDKSDGRLEEINAFANKHGLTENFTKTFRRLENTLSILTNI